jgi:hypothetical protein
MLKFTIILALLASLVVLGRALLALVTAEERELLHHLSWRMMFSVFAFLILMVAFAMGWVHPHPLGAPAISQAHPPK